MGVLFCDVWANKEGFEVFALELFDVNQMKGLCKEFSVLEFSCPKVERFIELDCPDLVFVNWHLFGRMLFGHCSCLTLSYKDEMKC